MATNRKASAARSTDSRTHIVLIIILIAVLTVGCIWAASRLNSRSETEQNIPSLPAGTDLERVIVPGDVPQQIKAYEGFTVNFNTSNRTPNYVSWELLGSETDGSSTRKKQDFWRDETVKNCPSKKDYTNSGYDRGHLYPAADAKWSETSMRECFSMANMTPQVHALNGGAWKTLEDKERQWAKRDSALIIVAGPIYQSADNLRIGQAGVRVPSAFFKVILAPYIDNPRAIAFIYPNDHCPGNMQNYAQSVDYVEQITGFDFFSSLPDDIEEQLESSYSFTQWNR
ncbi:MAG: DNA/RNA non-specific endonuclease [Muribaculaceae bacterium]|nr:DNA/RNA non-specific endonuclease [Muribaculaceae bacterium]